MTYGIKQEPCAEFTSAELGDYEAALTEVFLKTDEDLRAGHSL